MCFVYVNYINALYVTSIETLLISYRAPEIDISELESLFSVASASDGVNKGAGPRGSKINKPEKVQLVFTFIHLSICRICSLYHCLL